jgi:hypothetical protein
MHKLSFYPSTAKFVAAFMIAMLVVAVLPVKPVNAAVSSLDSWVNLLNNTEPNSLNYVTAPVHIQHTRGSTGTGTAASFSLTPLLTVPANGNTLIAVISTRGTLANRVSTIIQTGSPGNQCQWHNHGDLVCA